MKQSFLLCTAVLSSFAMSSQAAIVITEFMYQGAGNGPEFIEFTNIGSTAIDMTGWSFDDDSNVPGTISLSAYGVVEPGQSVILTDATADDFRALWGLSESVLIIGENSAGLGRNDAIHLYDNNGELADRLAYGDQDFPGTLRTQGFSAVTDPGNYGEDDISGWVASTIGDGLSFTSSAGDIGSPGVAVIPEASSLLLGALGGLAFLRRRR